MQHDWTKNELKGTFKNLHAFCLSTFSSSLPIPQQWFSNFSSGRIPQRAFQAHRFLDSRVSDSVDLICISNKFPVNTDTIGPEYHTLRTTTLSQKPLHIILLVNRLFSWLIVLRFGISQTRNISKNQAMDNSNSTLWIHIKISF